MTYDPALFEEVRSTGTLGLTAQWNEDERAQQDLVAPGSSIICIPIITQISLTSAAYWWKLVDQRTVRVWMHAKGSQTPLDQWRGWVDLKYELVCSQRRAGVHDNIPVECPPSDTKPPTEGGTADGDEGSGFDSRCVMVPGETTGTIMCMPYVIKNGKKIYGFPYPCGVCAQGEYP